MTRNIYLLLGLTVLLMPSALLSQSTDAEIPTTGKVLLLENDRVLQGDIERLGTQYRIRRSIGETLLPGDKVRYLCGSLEEAYVYLRNQANLDDADERLRLARWCHLHGLRRQALDEVTAAVRLRPDHADSQRLLRGLQRALDNDTTVAPPPPKEDAEGTTSPTMVACNAAALALFLNRVQPILMNACARCHATGKGGQLKLARGPEGGGLTNRRTTLHNLSAALAFVNHERPADSPLLTYAVTLHGDTDQPPLKNRTTPAFRTLEEWVQLIVADTPRPTASVAVGPALARPPGPEVVPTKKPVASMETPTTAAVNLPPATEPITPPAHPEEPSNQQPSNEDPNDPFDPAIFNRQMHPTK